VDWTAIPKWWASIDWLAVSRFQWDTLGTFVLAISTTVLALVTRRGVRENKRLIEASKRQADLLWENAVPFLIPENVDGVPTIEINMSGRLKISYAAGTIPARTVKAWVGAGGEVRFGTNDLLTPIGNNVKVLELIPSRAGSEPPKEWDQWLRRKEDGIPYRVVMRWSGPGDHITERAWWVEHSFWVEVPESLRG
jgi:hypothetical protein